MLHACTRLVDEDERITILHVEAHLDGDDAVQRVETLAHVHQMRIQEEPIGVCQAEHPLSSYRYQLAERLRGDLSRQADSHAILARRFLADLGLPVVEVASIHPDLSAEVPGGHVALKKGLICRPECVYRFHTVPIL